MNRRVKNRKSTSNHNRSGLTTSVVHQTGDSSTATQSQNSTEIPRFMNTYSLEPKNRFNCSLVYTVLEEVIHKQCIQVTYDPEKFSLLVQNIAGEIMRRVKQFDFDRYRLIVFVEIGSVKKQELETAVKFLWDASKDRLVTYNFTNGLVFASATCFAIYQD